jgi:hypothetical protein
MSSQKPVIALSLKARGLTVTPTIPRTRQLLLPTLGQSIVDISIAICVQIVLLSWSAWLSVLLVILCCVFYANYKDGEMAAADGSIMIPIALLIYLPCLGLVYTVRPCAGCSSCHVPCCSGAAAVCVCTHIMLEPGSSTICAA